MPGGDSKRSICADACSGPVLILFGEDAEVLGSFGNAQCPLSGYDPGSRLFCLHEKSVIKPVPADEISDRVFKGDMAVVALETQTEFSHNGFNRRNRAAVEEGPDSGGQPSTAYF